MNTAALAFRFRVVIFVLLYVLAFCRRGELSFAVAMTGTLWLAVSTCWPRAAAGSAWQQQL